MCVVYGRLCARNWAFLSKYEYYINLYLELYYTHFIHAIERSAIKSIYRLNGSLAQQNTFRNIEGFGENNSKPSREGICVHSMEFIILLQHCEMFWRQYFRRVYRTQENFVPERKSVWMWYFCVCVYQKMCHPT